MTINYPSVQECDASTGILLPTCSAEQPYVQLYDFGGYAARPCLCFCGTVRALAERVCAPRPSRKSEGSWVVPPFDYDVYMCGLYRRVPQWTFREVALQASAEKRRLYLRAAADLDAGVNPMKGSLNIFPKNEVQRKPIEEKAQRVIQAVPTLYVVASAVHIAPFEEMFYELVDCVDSIYLGSRICPKGLNTWGVAALLYDKAMVVGEGWRAFSADCKSYSSRYTDDCAHRLNDLIAKYASYEHAKCVRLLDFESDLEEGFRRRYRARAGKGDERTMVCDYEVEGGVLPDGSRRTSIGAHEDISRIEGPVCMRYVRCGPVCCGDDSLIFCRSQDYDAVKRDIMLQFADAGHDLSIEHEASVLEEIVLCQCSPVELRPGVWRMVRKPKRLIQSYAVVDQRYSDNVAGWLAAVSACELSLCAGVPVLQEFALMLARSSGGAEPTKGVGEGRYLFASEESSGPTDIHAVARASFSRAFDITVGEQLALERHFAEMSLDLTISEGEGCQTLGYFF